MEYKRFVHRLNSRPDDDEEPTAERLLLEEGDQESSNQRIIDESNALLLQEQVTLADRRDEQAPRTPRPSTPPPHGPKEGLPVDPDLLSPYLNRLRIDPP